MPKTKEISLELRKKIVEAHERFTVSRTAVSCIIAKYKEINSAPRESKSLAIQLNKML